MWLIRKLEKSVLLSGDFNSQKKVKKQETVVCLLFIVSSYYIKITIPFLFVLQVQMDRRVQQMKHPTYN